MGNVGLPELIIIVLLILVFFGSKKIPELAQGLGKGMKEFRKATREMQEDDKQDVAVAELKPPAAETTACIHCGARVAKDVKFCPTCGKSLEPPTCSKCGRVNQLGHKFCSQCGEKLT